MAIMTAGTDTEGATSVVIGTATTVEVMRISLLAQTLKMVGMARPTAPATVSPATAMDSPLLPTKRQQRSLARIASRPSSLQPQRWQQLRTALSPLQPTPHFLSLRHKRHHSTPHPWCPTRCLLSSLSKKKNPYTQKKIFIPFVLM